MDFFPFGFRLADLSLIRPSCSSTEANAQLFCSQSRFLQILVRTLCVLGVGMIMGDGVLTPAISVVSAIEGLGQIPGGGGTLERSECTHHSSTHKHALSYVHHAPGWQTPRRNSHVIPVLLSCTGCRADSAHP